MKSCLQVIGLMTVCLLGVAVGPLHADTTEFFNDGSLALVAADAALEAPVPIYHNGTLIGGHNHKLVEAFDQVPGTGSFPLVFVDMHANTFIRNTYQKSDGGGAALGTSVVGSTSFRTGAGLQYIPGITRGDVFTNGFFGRYYSQIQGTFGAQASITTTRKFPDPVVGETTVGLTVDFTADQDIDLATGFVTGNDRFRMMTVSSMFSSSTVYDADILRYEDSNGDIQTRQLSDTTVRGTYVLPVADEVGGWIELIKSPGSMWFSDSPTIRIDLTDKGGMRLGVQGYLAGTTDPNDDSLSVWLEWLDAPDTVTAGTALGIDVNVVATADPDRPVITGDLNADGFVGIEDLNTVLGNWNRSVLSGYFTACDPTGDGFVGIEDLNTVLGNWNTGTPPADQTGLPIPTPSMCLLLAVGLCRGLMRPMAG
jgi:hypothetical protein